MSQHSASPARSGRRRFAPVALLGGVAATAVLALSMNGTLAGFTAQITNSVNSAASGTLTMQESTTGGSPVVCNSTDGTGNNVSNNVATCATINKYGGSTVLYPGLASSTTVTIKNTGTVSAGTFVLKPGTCTQSTNGSTSGNANDFCSKLNVSISQNVGGTVTTVTPTNSTAASLAALSGGLTLTSVNPGQTITYIFTVTLDSAAGNSYQGLAAAQPLVWTFTS